MSVQSFSLEVPKVKKKRWGKPKPGESLKMLAAGSLAFAKAYSSVEKLEHELEAELQRDKDNDPKQGKGIHKLRRKGGKWLLNKYVLLFIVVVNIIDCALVLGELILDLHHVKDILTKSEEMTSTFLSELQLLHPDQFSMFKPNQIELAYDTVLSSKMIWPNSAHFNISLSKMAAFTGSRNVTSFLVQSNTSDVLDFNKSRFVTDGDLLWLTNVTSPVYNTGSDVGLDLSGNRKSKTSDSVLGLMGFVFHKISLSISVFLVIWLVLKILCFGRHLLDRKLEVFDTFVILTSFTVDMIFVKGLSSYSLQDFVFILAFMLPWRVIRVTNSLVVAVKDHEHFRLKMLFTQKKKIEHDNKQIRADRENYKEQVDALKKLCLNEGIDDWKIFQSLASQPIRPGGKGAMGSFASLAFGAFHQKSTSFWSVLGTPKMRRGKSMEFVDNKIINHDAHTTKRHSKGRLLGLLGSSTDFFRGKIRHGHNLSLESDPGLANSYLKHHGHQANGHIGNKRLTRGETIDTASTDSLDCVVDKGSIDDFSRQGTYESNDDSRQGTFASNDDFRQGTFESNEDSRQGTFESNEDSRQGTFESNDDSRQGTFESNEDSRQGTFESNDDSRQGTFESNEESRQGTIESHDDSKQGTFESNEDSRQGTFESTVCEADQRSTTSEPRLSMQTSDHVSDSNIANGTCTAQIEHIPVKAPSLNCRSASENDKEWLGLSNMHQRLSVSDDSMLDTQERNDIP